MDIDFYREVLAHGIVAGFSYTVRDSAFEAGEGLGYCRGLPFRGDWQVDFAGKPAGWWSVSVNEAGVIASRGMFDELSVPLALCLTDCDGMVQIIRDVRRHCWPFVWQGTLGCEARLAFAPLQPLRLRRVQAATCEPQAMDGLGVWHCCLVTLPTQLGNVHEGWFSAPLKLDKAGPLGVGLVVEGYTL